MTQVNAVMADFIVRTARESKARFKPPKSAEKGRQMADVYERMHAFLQKRTKSNFLCFLDAVGGISQGSVIASIYLEGAMVTWEKCGRERRISDNAMEEILVKMKEVFGFANMLCMAKRIAFELSAPSGLNLVCMMVGYADEEKEAIKAFGLLMGCINACDLSLNEKTVEMLDGNLKAIDEIARKKGFWELAEMSYWMDGVEKARETARLTYLAPDNGWDGGRLA